MLLRYCTNVVQGPYTLHTYSDCVLAVLPQHSNRLLLRTDCTEQSMSSRPVRHPPIAALPSRPRTPAAFAGEHKTHPLHTLLTTNYRLPTDIDRCNLEKHLSDIDFEFAFGMPRPEFYAMPTWRRNELKKRAHLF